MINGRQCDGNPQRRRTLDRDWRRSPGFIQTDHDHAARPTLSPHSSGTSAPRPHGLSTDGSATHPARGLDAQRKGQRLARDARHARQVVGVAVPHGGLCAADMRPPARDGDGHGGPRTPGKEGREGRVRD